MGILIELRLSCYSVLVIAMELFFARLGDNHAIKGEEMWWCGWFRV